MFLEAAEQKAGQVGLGWAVTHLREQAGLTAAELSGRSGLSDAELKAVERGHVDPTWGRLRRIAYGINTELENLLQLGIELAPGPAGGRLRKQDQVAGNFDAQGVARDEGKGERT
jgi:transcriptional regulator with XRE-family HTH domain